MNIHAVTARSLHLQQRARILALAFSFALAAVIVPAMQAHAASGETAVAQGQTAENVDANGNTVSSRTVRITNVRANASGLISPKAG